MNQLLALLTPNAQYKIRYVATMLMIFISNHLWQLSFSEEEGYLLLSPPRELFRCVLIGISTIVYTHFRNLSIARDNLWEHFDRSDVQILIHVSIHTECLDMYWETENFMKWATYYTDDVDEDTTSMDTCTTYVNE